MAQPLVRLLHLRAPKEDEEVKQEVATSLAADLASSLDAALLCVDVSFSHWSVFSLDKMIFMLFSAGFAQSLVSIMLRG